MLHRCGLSPKAPGDQRSQWQHDRGRDCLVVGARSARPRYGPLLEAYLDRRFAGWRQHAERHDDAGPRSGTPSGPMPEQEAYQVLGLKPGASAEEVRRVGIVLRIHRWADHSGGGVWSWNSSIQPSAEPASCIGQEPPGPGIDHR